LVVGASVDLGHGEPGLRLPTAPRLASRDDPLGLAELSLGLAVELGGGDARPVGQDREVFQTEVDPHDTGRVDRWQLRIGHLESGRQRDEPAAEGIAAERRPPGRRVHVHRLAEADPAHLGDDDMLAVDPHPPGDAGPDRVTPLALGVGEPGPFLEEVAEGPIQVPERLLQGLGVRFGEPGRLGSPLRGGQLGRERRGGDRRPMPGEVGFPPIQGPIPHPSPGTGQSVQGVILNPGRSHAESVDLAADGQGSDSFLVLDVLLDRGQRGTPDGRDEVTPYIPTPEGGGFTARFGNFCMSGGAPPEIAACR
jgi:hypothetical protein